MDPQQLMGGYTSHSNDDFADLQGLSLSSSPVKPSSSSGRASSVEPSSGQSLPMFVQQDDLDGLEDDDEDEEGRKGKKGLPNPGRRKIEIEYIEDKVSVAVGRGQSAVSGLPLADAYASLLRRASDISPLASAKQAS